MGRETRDRLAAWLKETARRSFSGKAALVCLFGSHVNGTANEHSDLDCYFVPKTGEGRALARTFLLQGVGYDFFPLTWERLEGLARLEEPLLPLLGDARVLWFDTAGDLLRFRQLQGRLAAALRKKDLREAAARERAGRAWSWLPDPDCGLGESRLQAGFVLMDLAEALALREGTYFHNGLKRQFSDLLALRALPERFEERYLAVLKGETPREIGTACRALLESCPWPDSGKRCSPARSGPPDPEALAALYEELASTFQKIYRCAESGDRVLAYLSAVCLQRDLPWLELVSAYRYDDLAPLAGAARQAEAEVRRAVREGGAVLREYASFEQFEQAQKERGC